MTELDGQPPRVDTGRRAIEVIALVALAVVFLGISVWRQWGDLHADARRTVGLIIAAGLTLIMYSFLYRDNALFKIAENLYVGVTLGYTAVMVWRQALLPEVVDPFAFSPSTAALYDALLHRSVPILLGVLLLTRLSRKYSWLSRYSYGLIVGWGAGVGIVFVTNSYILRQLSAAIAPLQSAAEPGLAAWTGVWWWSVVLPVAGSVLVLVGTISVLFYFFFSVEHRGASGAVSRMGVWFLMISFGASFGYTVMGRLSLLIGRVQFLLFEWLKIPQ